MSFAAAGRPAIADASAAAQTAESRAGRRGSALWRWHPRAVVLAASLLVAVLLSGLGLVLASTQATSRRDAEQRFVAQATTAAGLTKAIFSTIAAPAGQAASKAFSGPTVSPRALKALARTSKLEDALIFGADGDVLATSASDAPIHQAADAVRRALGGVASFSDLFRGADGTYVVGEAIPFASPHGRRVELLVYRASILSAFLGSYLDGALPEHSSHGLVVDGHGRLVASSVAGASIGDKPNAGLLSVLQRAPGDAPVQGAYELTSGPSRGSRYVVGAPIGGSRWRVAITESTSALYPADVGSRSWLIWLVFAAFALAAGGCVLLLRRSLRSAAVQVRQARRVEEINQELEATNAELNAFSYSVSHDLRAPLRAIDGFSRIVVEDESGTLSDEQVRYLGLVRTNTQLMGELIDDLLSFARLANAPINRREVDTRELVEEVERELRAQEPGALALEFDNGELPVVEADPALLRQVFANLLGNAVKYSRTREPAVVAVASEHRDGELVFTVRDNGVGFDMRYADKLFQVFQRLHRADDYEGTGVGLAIVQRIVTRHGGRVWAESTVESGASFHFTLKEMSA